MKLGLKKDTVIGLSILFGMLLIFAFFIKVQWLLIILLITIDIAIVGLLIGIIKTLRSGMFSKAGQFYLLIALIVCGSLSIFGHSYLKISHLNTQVLIIMGVMALIFSFIRLK